MSTWIVGSILLSLLTAWYVARPLFDPILADASEGDVRSSYLALVDRKDRAIRALKDLALDYQMGKLSPEDFEALKHALTLEATEILDELSNHDRR